MIDITLKTPQTEEDLKKVFGEFKFLQCFSPIRLSDDELWEILVDDLPFNTLVYGNGLLIGCYTLDVYARSAELHGIARPDMADVIPHSKRVKVAIYRGILEDVFRRLNKDKLIIKAPSDYLGVVGFCRMFGFKRLQNLDKGRVVWKLSREDWEKDGKEKESA